jgi:hypothetical protein
MMVSLSSNATSIRQPMDQGMTASLKQNYWAGLLRILADDNLLAFWKQITLLDVL